MRWKLIHYMRVRQPARTFKLPREEEICGLSIVLNTHYAKPTKLELYFDDDPSPWCWPPSPTASRQDFDLAPRKARSLTIKLAEFDQVEQDHAASTTCGSA